MEKVMRNTKSRFALAAVLASLSVPAFAADAAPSSIAGEGTWPVVENPAPAFAVNAQGGEVQALLRDNPTWPATDNASPAIALVAVPDDGGPQIDPVEVWVRTPSFAVVLPGAQAPEQVATVR
jgi:hypothetical protein